MCDGYYAQFLGYANWSARLNFQYCSEYWAILTLQLEGKRCSGVFLEQDDFGLNGTIKLQNDGEGDYIKSWEHPTLTKPTDEELA